MKTLFLPLLFLAALIRPSYGQESTGDQATLLDPIIIQPPVTPAQPAPAQKRLEVPAKDIISSKILYREGQKFTVQKITPQKLQPPPPKPPASALPSQQVADRVANASVRQRYRPLMLACTVYDSQKTMIRWSSQGQQPVKFFTAWSNVNFHYFASLYRFKKKDITYALMFGIGDVNAAQMSQLFARRKATYSPPITPELPNDATLEPTFVVTEGDPSPADLEPIVGLHELYKEHHAALIAKHQHLTMQREQEAARQAANPPVAKPDIVIQYWNIDPNEQSANATKGGKAL